MINFSELLWRTQASAQQAPATPSTPPPVNGNSDIAALPVTVVHLEPESRIALITDPRGPGADRFRLMRMRLREVRAKTNLRSLVITSALPLDGKSTVALNLATALAEGGKRSVLLIEADLHHPTLAQSLGVQPQPGLAECLEKNLDPMSAIRRLEPLSWYLLQAGQAESNPTEALQSESVRLILEKLTERFDWVLLDTPPAAPLTDAISLSRYVDACVVVVRADSTPRNAVEEVINRIGRERVLGLVFNGAEGLNRVYSKYYGYYDKR